MIIRFTTMQRLIINVVFLHNNPNTRFNEDLLHHMSPLGWEHINLLGEYHFNLEKLVSLDSLRPLRLS